MSDNFNITLEWQPRDYGTALERSTLAELSILIGDKWATELEDAFAKTIKRSSRLSAHDLASWFTANWWRLRWEPEGRDSAWLMSHHLGAVGGGYVWPNVSFSSDGDTILVRARPTAGDRIEPIRYLGDFDISVSAAEFEEGIDRFLETVIARLSVVQANDDELGQSWREVLEERANPGLSEYRKMEALMGLDPGEAPTDLTRRILTAGKTYGRLPWRKSRPRLSTER